LTPQTTKPKPKTSHHSNATVLLYITTTDQQQHKTHNRYDSTEKRWGRKVEGTKEEEEEATQMLQVLAI
jgi:hypothetical protein